MRSALVLILCLTCLPASADENGRLVSKISVDWQKGMISLQVEALIDRSGPNAATAESSAQLSAENALPTLFLRELGPLPVESGATVDDILRRNRESGAAEYSRNPLATRAAQIEADEQTAFRFASLANAIEGAGAVGRRVYTRNSADQRRVELRYDYRLHEVFKRLLGLDANSASDRPQAVRKNLVWTPVSAWTGLIIHAADALPVHGEHTKEPARRCGFPAIYDSEMEPVLTRSMIKPERLSDWGVAAYTADADDKAGLERVGPNPLRTYAVGVYGRYRGDLMIPREDARRLLASEPARAALAEGRVLIVIR
jgi:hypothetical protein